MKLIKIKGLNIMCVIVLLFGTVNFVYPQHASDRRNALEYVLQKSKRNRITYSDSLGFFKRTYFTFGCGMESGIRGEYSFKKGINNNVRIGLGGWFTPVIGIEAVGFWSDMPITNLINGNESWSRTLPNRVLGGAEFNYLINITNFTFRSSKRHRMNVVAVLGVNGRGGKTCYAYGVHVGLRGIYQPKGGLGLWFEPRLGVSSDLIDGKIGQRRTYHIMPSLSCGLQLSMYNPRKYYDEQFGQRVAFFSLKTNMIYNMSLTPNIELEIAVGNHWSLNVEYQLGWWLRKDHTFCWEFNAAGLEARYWLGKRTKTNRMLGWFTGIYGSGGVYDIQLLPQEGYQGQFYIFAGLTLGYAFPVARGCNFEFSTGVGYIVSEYKKYDVMDGDLVKKGREMRFESILPAKAKMSLVWSIGRKLRKGGVR